MQFVSRLTCRLQYLNVMCRVKKNSWFLKLPNHYSLLDLCVFRLWLFWNIINNWRKEAKVAISRIAICFDFDSQSFEKNVFIKNFAEFFVLLFVHYRHHEKYFLHIPAKKYTCNYSQKLKVEKVESFWNLGYSPLNFVSE